MFPRLPVGTELCPVPPVPPLPPLPPPLPLELAFPFAFEFALPFELELLLEFEFALPFELELLLELLFEFEFEFCAAIVMKPQRRRSRAIGDVSCEAGLLTKLPASAADTKYAKVNAEILDASCCDVAVPVRLPFASNGCVVRVMTLLA